MTEVIIRNKKILAKLNSFADELFSIEGYNNPNYRMYGGEFAMTNPEYYCSNEWLHHKMNDWISHSGFPEEHYSQPMTNMARESSEKFEALKNKIRTDFTTEIGAMHAALTNYYPPGGFVGWHTNWNANCYQILFTWSKTGNGYFKYYDKQKDEIVTIQDVPGWQCRHFYFGRKDEPDHHCWHAAYAGEDRITLAYKFTNGSLKDPMDTQARMLRDQLIEEIESEE
jgi:hypothetical protein